MLRIDQIKLSIDESDEALYKRLLKILRIDESAYCSHRIYRKNIDARHGKVMFAYSVDVEVKNEAEILRRKLNNVRKSPEIKYIEPSHGDKKLSERPIIIGFGPAGMFCALLLAQKGYCPIVFDRGAAVEKRVLDVKTFTETGVLKEESNIQFGEGGAGTFSDGKLTARSKDLRVHKIYQELVNFGAPSEILFDANPHVGSDKLIRVVKNIREEIIRLGGEIRFDEKVTNLIIENQNIVGVETETAKYPTEIVIAALGNSSRDSFKKFHQQGVAMEAKPFAIGLRIEHKQVDIDKALYHEAYEHPNLHVASYRLTHRHDDCGIYTFCMCPGGEVVAATSLENRVVVNGMSKYKRNLENANSAVLVQVNENDYGDSLFDGMKFQDELEQKAFQLGGSSYAAPVQLVSDFLNNQASSDCGQVKPSYPLGVTYTNLNELLPLRIADNLKEGLRNFAKKNEAFKQGDAILTGIETRSSSPIRILRDEKMESISIANFYPVGEGSGYAGGIVSSAIDGLRCAEFIIEKYQPMKSQK